MKQETIVEDYLKKYEALVPPLQNLLDAVMEGPFMNGLKPKVQVEVRMMKPKNLAQMIEATQLVDERNRVLSLGWAGAGGHGSKTLNPALGPLPPSPKQVHQEISL